MLDNIALQFERDVFVFTTPDTLFNDAVFKFKDLKSQKIIIDNRSIKRKNQDLEDYQQVTFNENFIVFKEKQNIISSNPRKDLNWPCLHHSDELGCIIHVYGDINDPDATCLDIFDNTSPYPPLSKTSLSYGCNFAAFATDRRIAS